MSTLTALKDIPKRYQLFVSAFTRTHEQNLHLSAIPTMIQYLFILFYIESDEWIPNEFYKLSNNNQTITHLKNSQNKYSYI